MQNNERTLCAKCKSWLNMSMEHTMEHLDTCAGPRSVAPLPLQKRKEPALTEQEQDLVDRERMRCLGIIHTFLAEVDEDLDLPRLKGILSIITDAILTGEK